MSQDQNPDSLSAALTVPPRRTLPQPALVLAVGAILASGALWLYQLNAMEQLKGDLASQLANNQKLQQELKTNQQQMATLQQQMQAQLTAQGNQLAESASRQESHFSHE